MMRLCLAAALAIPAVAALGVPGASGQTGPIGYTYGAQVFGVGFVCGFYAIDLPTGEAQQLTDDLDCADGLAFAADGTLYGYVTTDADGVADAVLVTIDTATGVQTVVGDLPPVATFSGGMTFDAAGNLWLYAPPTATGLDPDCAPTVFETCLWRVDPSTAASEFVGAGPPDLNVYGLTATCDAVEALTFPTTEPFDASLQQVDTSTASLAEIVGVPGITSLPAGLDHDPTGGLWALASTQSAGAPTAWDTHQIDPTTGDTTTARVTIGGDEFVGILSGLGIAPLSCAVPTPAPVVLQPTFTG